MLSSLRLAGIHNQVNVRGRLPVGGVAIIGSRTPPPEAEVFAFELARRLGEAIISGLAPGIDVAAHRGALAANTPTVAFVGYGFGCTDPPEHLELEDQIVAAGGAIATLLPPGTPASAESTIERDRLQAEHARAVVLVCTEIEGGAMHAMQFAAELARPRFAVTPPPDIATRAQWAGNLACIADGAMPLPFDAVEASALIRACGLS